MTYAVFDHYLTPLPSLLRFLVLSLINCRHKAMASFMVDPISFSYKNQIANSRFVVPESLCSTTNLEALIRLNFRGQHC